MPQKKHRPPDFEPREAEEKEKRHQPIDYSGFEKVDEEVLEREEEEGE